MLLRFKELYFCNGVKTILVEIETKYELPKDFKYVFKDVFKGYNVYVLNFEYGCLDIFETEKLINKILNKYNLDYIDKELWNQFLEDKYKEEIDKYGKTVMFNKLKPHQADSSRFKELPKYKIDLNYDNYKYIWKCSETVNDCCKVLIYEERILNSEDYAYTLLNIIFNCNFDLKIMKCEICGKPFITFTKNQKKCHRIYKNGITCNRYSEKMRKANQYDDYIKHLIKNVRDKLKDNAEELKKFNEILPVKKEQFFNDKKSFIKWILDNYYYTEKGKEAVIERLGLSKYL